MAEPISDAELAEIRHLMESATHVEGEIIGRIDLGSCDSNDVRGLIARIDRAEAKLERIRKAIPRNQYLSLSMLVEVKEIVHG